MLIGLVQAGAFLTALFSIATLFNSLHSWLELFSHFRLQYFVCALLFAVVFAVLRNRRWCGGMLALAVVNFLPLAPWYLPAGNATPVGARTLTLLQANVLGHDNAPGQVVAQIRASAPDIVFLQEIDSRWVDALRVIEDELPYRLAVPRDDNFGIAVYAKEPLLDVEIIESPPLKLPTLVVRQDIGGRQVTFVTTHPVPPLGREMTASRNEQLQSIAALLAGTTGPRVLVGDLNITMWAHHYRELESVSGLRNTRLGHGVAPTWPRRLPFAAIPIDHCLVSGELIVLDTRAGRANGSDHLPLLIDLAL